MQWTGDRNGGFSRADPARLFAPQIMDPVYGFQAVNVEAQERSAFSLLNWMKRMIALRKQYQVFGRGTIEFLHPQNRKVLIYVRRFQDDTILCIANLSRSVQPVELDLARFKGLIPIEMLGLTEFPRIGDLPYFLTLSPYSFFWFRLQAAVSPIAARIAPELSSEVPHAPGLLVGAAWETLLEGNVRTLIERDLLLPFLQRQRWFGAKGRPARAARFVDWGVLRKGSNPLFMTLVEVEFEDGGRDQYFLPLAVCGSAESCTVTERAPHAVLAGITGARKGLLFDAWIDDGFARTLLEVFDREEQVKTRRGAFRARQTTAYRGIRGTIDDAARVSRTSAEQSNTSIVYGDRQILKLFRRFQPGINPDFEVSRHLTEKIGWSRVPAVTGSIDYERPAEPLTTTAMMQRLVESQGDGWTHATDELGRFYDHIHGRQLPTDGAPRTFPDLAAAKTPARIHEAIGAYLDTAASLGRRTGELHLALAMDSSDRAFSPEPFGKPDLVTLSIETMAQAQRALKGLEAALSDVAPVPDGAPAGAAPRIPPEVAERAARLLASRDVLLEKIRSSTTLEFTAAKIRVHGDYHLGQVLWAEGDFYILDFEGEPLRTLAERRQKQSPLKDVAGMLRSFDYAAYASLFARTPSQPAEFTRLEPWGRLWQTWTTGAFLRGYFDVTGDAVFLPADPGQRDALLRFFMLDKALYELNYEINNRPDWVRIPLWGIFELLQ
jgi:maltose alpha-D-glucosyltransferase / alpha-amylase